MGTSAMWRIAGKTLLIVLISLAAPVWGSRQAGVAPQLMGKIDSSKGGKLLKDLDKVKSALSPKQLRLLRKAVKASMRKKSKDRFNLRQLTFDPTIWKPPGEEEAQTTINAQIFDVIIYPVTPFVVIDDVEGETDPGNVMQTRTPDNERISGMAIELLEDVSEMLNLKFRYFYPCKIADYDAGGSVCPQPTVNDALDMMDGAAGTDFYGTGADFCPDSACFVGGAPKITEARVKKYDVTQPFLEKGFIMVVKAEDPTPRFMSWADPLHWFVWVLVVAELIFCAICFMVVEGYGSNEALWSSSNILAQFYDSLYWSITLLLGAADKSPTTHAGRILVGSHLFFGVLLLTLYTANLATFLATSEVATRIAVFDDLVDVNSEFYGDGLEVCVPKAQQSVETWLSIQESLNNVVVKRVEAENIEECMHKVWVEEADATFYDEPVVLTIMNEMYKSGRCGDDGGFCSDDNYESAEQCECPEKTLDGECLNPAANKWTGVAGQLVTTGSLFSPFGYGLMFEKTADQQDYYVAFSQAIQWLKERGFVSIMEEDYIPPVESIQCSSGLSGDEVQLDFVNIQGLVTITAFILFIGLCMGTLENIIMLCVAVLPCCATICLKLIHKPEEHKEEHQGPTSPRSKRGSIINEAELAKKARMEKLHAKITDLQGRLEAVEKQLAPKEENGENGIEDQRGNMNMFQHINQSLVNVFGGTDQKA